VINQFLLRDELIRYVLKELRNSRERAKFYRRETRACIREARKGPAMAARNWLEAALACRETERKFKVGIKKLKLMLLNLRKSKKGTKGNDETPSAPRSLDPKRSTEVPSIREFR
jgi:hypothetical protein